MVTVAASTSLAEEVIDAVQEDVGDDVEIRELVAVEEEFRYLDAAAFGGMAEGIVVEQDVEVVEEEEGGGATVS